MVYNSAKNKIIFLVAPPRSLSTAFLRMMEARQDFKIMNEPTCCVYNSIHYPHSKSIYSKQSLTTYNEVKNKILNEAKEHPVFIKEMSFSFEELIEAEPDLMKDPNIYFVFLLRNPHHCIISYYNRIPQHTIDFIISDFLHLTGYPSLYNSFKVIQEHAIHKPYIVHAEHLYTDTVRTIEALCNHIEIPFQQEHLSWSNLGEDFTGINEWHENKTTEFTHHWHKDAIISKNFHKPTHYHSNEWGTPTFNEIKNTAHQTQCLNVYEHSKNYYDLIQNSDRQTQLP